MASSKCVECMLLWLIPHPFLLFMCQVLQWLGDVRQVRKEVCQALHSCYVNRPWHLSGGLYFGRICTKALIGGHMLNKYHFLHSQPHSGGSRAFPWFHGFIVLRACVAGLMRTQAQSKRSGERNPPPPPPPPRSSLCCCST